MIIPSAEAAENIVVCVATTNDASTDVAADAATEVAAASGPVSSGLTHTHTRAYWH